MPISPEDVAHTAKLAQLELTEAEIERFCRELGRITEYMAQLSEAITGDEPSEPVLPLIKNAQALRDDVVVPSFDQKTALSQAPDSKDGFFRVPKVIG
ncbi:MAG: Asp-tRNA(Asn)/Glu-tRNA(Gln) amidotransferase subunit GatC [candidate division Zixibacteria bacterium]|nr:Asp-tRNA(Asn)/Glu-tRNA(Gln) amidotransferase subunit GatC [candidate division Zixibacteria bacterium]